jgi:rare lipoprotein A (peptidoglycan hydrolase)
MLACARNAALVALGVGMMLAGQQARANPLVKTIETGQASWYGQQHNGRRTSSGAVFDDRELTAAHPSLPLGMHVRVTSLDSGESVIVTINDRQPPHGSRVIDLSRAAAARIGMIGSGTAHVELTRVTPEELAADAADQNPPEEVAEAPIDAAPRGLPRRHRGVRAASTARTCCHARSAARVRH